MKKILIAILIYSSAIFTNGYAQGIKDPLLDYYQAVRNSERSSTNTKIYSFEADFTEDGHKSIFITTDLAFTGPHTGYSWEVYYPLVSGTYQDLGGNIDARLHGPPYIGYISELKRYGIVNIEQGSVCVAYLSQGKIKTVILGESQKSSKENYPQYFAKPMNWNIQTYTLAQLAQKYPSP